jgi:long-chain acyl-CoA synthetase
LDGDVLHAVIVPNGDRLPRLDRNALDEWFRSQVTEPYNATVAPYRQVLKVTVSHDELPRTRLSKLRRHLLSDMASRLSAAAAEPARHEASADGASERLLAFFDRHCGRRVSVVSRLQADLGLDSLGRVELSVFIERVFGVVLAESRLAQVDTIAELASLLAQQQIDEEAAPHEVSWASILKPKTGVELPRTSVYHLGIIYSSRLIVRCLFSVKVRRSVELPSGPFIVVPNHQSYIDGLFVCAYLHPRVVQSIMFYAKAQHVRRRIVKFLAARGNTVVMNPEEGYLGSLQQLAAGLRRGNRLMIFPEGTRSRDGELGAFKDAYAILSRELSVPVVPVVIDGAQAVLPRGARIPKFSRRVNLAYLEPMTCREGESAADFNRRVRAVIEAELAESRVEHDSYHKSS